MRPNNKEILNELEKYAPSLLQIEKSGDIDTPEGYFEYFHKEVLQKLGLSTEEPVYTTESDYFNQLPDQVIKKLRNQSAPTERRVISLSIWKRWAAAAAVFIIAIGTIFYQQTNVYRTETEISNEALLAIMEDYFNELRINSMMDQELLYEAWLLPEIELLGEEWITLSDHGIIDDYGVYDLDY
ncbi:MAG TPA: hypothetical protein PKC30_09185 [Saprospiraceae bacterium]|nr:hypothetical protein [Saprospiraceae bacterium]